MKNLTIPAAIVIAGALIGGALWFSNGGSQKASVGDYGSEQKNAAEENENSPAPITEKDHILGNPDAQIKIVEYSDTECPFCKKFHSTMQKIIDDYGKTGKVSWVYRHFPLKNIHSKSPKEAEATECAAKIGGNASFWDYINRLFKITPSDNGLDPNLLPQIAEDVGLDRSKFEKCLNSGEFKQRVQNMFDDAVAAGGTGTPYSIIMYGSKLLPIEGAQPYQSIKAVIENLLEESKALES